MALDPSSWQLPITEQIVKFIFFTRKSYTRTTSILAKRGVPKLGPLLKGKLQFTRQNRLKISIVKFTTRWKIPRDTRLVDPPPVPEPDPENRNPITDLKTKSPLSGNDTY